MDVAKYILSPKNLLLHLSLTYLGRLGLLSLNSNKSFNLGLDQNKEQADAAGKTFSDPLGKLATIKQLFVRSEEHTSELQSRQYLVCRLLLEKKKQHMVL